MRGISATYFVFIMYICVWVDDSKFMYVYVYVCMYVCMYVFLYFCIYIVYMCLDVLGGWQ